MTIALFVLNVAGAVMLLLFGVRLVRGGIEKSFGQAIQRLATRVRENRIHAAGVGSLLAILLQSSTAAILLTSVLVRTGLLGITGGLAMALGADLGSAVAVQLLSFQLDWLVPLLLAVGGWLNLRRGPTAGKQAGRVMIGIALILIALRLIGDAAEPVRDAQFMPAVADFLESDFIAAFLLGLAVAFAMHSSIGAVLVFVAFARADVLPVMAGVSLVLGANLGGALVPAWLSRSMASRERRVPVGNLTVKGTAALAMLPAVGLTPAMSVLENLEPGQALVLAHILFNGMVLVAAMPFVGILQRPLTWILPESSDEGKPGLIQYPSALGDSSGASPGLALSSLTREVLRAGQMIEAMTGPVMEIYENGNAEQIKSLRRLGDDANQSLTDIRMYAASLQRGNLKKEEVRRARELAEYSINLKSAEDIVLNKLLVLARKKNRLNVSFSREGWQEMVSIHDKVLKNMALALDVVLSGDIECARKLVEEKDSLSHEERKSRKRHLKRLRDGAGVSIESSDIHLETISGLKELNSNISAAAYPVLARSGQLLHSRLVEG